MSALKTYKYYNQIKELLLILTWLTYLIEHIYLKVQTGERDVKGFAVTGLYPVTRDLFTEDDYLAANQNETGHEGAQSQNMLQEVVQDEQRLASCESNNLVLNEHMKIPNLEKKLPYIT
nr:unnamed protein product [Callosobruchus analis]